MKSIIYDIEVYPNRFCIALLIDGKMTIIDEEQRIKKLPLDDPNYLWIGFNNRRYDHPILQKIQNGGWTTRAYWLSDQIINKNNECISWNTNIVDLLEICPKISKCSLKEFGHRLKYPILQNLPYPDDKDLNDEEWKEVKRYCIHDVKITEMLWEKLKEEYYARQSLKKFFDIKTEFGGAPNLAQKAILSKIDDGYVDRSRRLYKQSNLKLSTFSQELYDKAFNISLKSYQEEKPDFMEQEYDINGCNIQLGIGGLHGFKKSGIYHEVYDYDVSSYYPSIILNCKLGSPKFRSIYKRVYDQRLYLKKNNQEGATALKLVLNSLYGKLSDKYSKKQIYAPNIALTICLLGQFYLIDLIEKLNPSQCICANTDGIIVTEPIPSPIIKEWEERTGFKLECTHYKTLILKDVNSYYAITQDGEEKRKNEFLLPTWTHNIKAPIIQEAVLRYLLNDECIDDIVFSHNSLYDFCFFTKVPKKGDKRLLLDGQPVIDRKVRYYIANEGHILERETPKQKARLCKDSPIKLAMNLLPIDNNTDINYDWYIKRVYELVEKIK